MPVFAIDSCLYLCLGRKPTFILNSCFHMYEISSQFKFIFVSSVGYLVSSEAWYDQSDVSLFVRVRDEVGGVQCQPAAVQIRATPSASLASVFNVIPQVQYVCILTPYTYMYFIIHMCMSVMGSSNKFSALSTSTSISTIRYASAHLQNAPNTSTQAHFDSKNF